MWLWHAGPGPLSLDELWRAYLARFDIEHAFKLLKGALGLTAAKVRAPEQADRWARLLMAACAQLLLARPLAADLRRPWEKHPDPVPPAATWPGPPGVSQHPPRPGNTRPCRETHPTRATAGPKAAAKAQHPATFSPEKPTCRAPRT